MRSTVRGGRLMRNGSSCRRTMPAKCIYCKKMYLFAAGVVPRFPDGPGGSRYGYVWEKYTYGRDGGSGDVLMDSLSDDFEKDKKHCTVPGDDVARIVHSNRDE